MTSELPKPDQVPEAAPGDRPKTLARGTLACAPPDLVPARMINEVLYCERLMYLEWSQGVFEDNAFTAEGREIVHSRVDRPRKRRSRGRAVAEDEAEAEPPPYDARSVWLSSERLGITGKIDIIDEGEGGAVVPVEYKRGSAPDVPERAYLPERAQVCAQALLLREHGHRCDEGSIYFAAERRRVPVAIDETLVAATLAAAARARALAAAGVLPPPLVNSPKCNGCSLVGICLPDEVGMLQGARSSTSQLELLAVSDLHGPMDSDPWGLVDSQTNAKLRRLHAARDDRLPVYVQTQGAYAHDSNNIELRVAQHAQLRDARVCLTLARGSFLSMVKCTIEPSFDFDGRNRRPPRDPLKALLSFAYALESRCVA